MKGPDNGLTKPVLIKTLAREVAKLMQKMGRKEFLSEFQYRDYKDGGRINISTTLPLDTCITTLTLGTDSPINLCKSTLKDKLAEELWPFFKRFHKRAMAHARRERARVLKVYTATDRFIKDNERLMSHHR